MVTFNEIVDWLLTQATTYGPTLLLALVVLVVGLWFIRLFGKSLDKIFTKRKIDLSLKHFLEALIDVILKVLLILTVISIVGIETTSFVAVLAAGAFAIGFALQGSLANFAGGVMILIFKPFKVGHFIESSGYMGTVDKIDILQTILKTPDNKTIILPNGPVFTSPLVNFSLEENRRVDMVFGIGYNDDIKSAKQILTKLVTTDRRVLKTPQPQIVVGELGESSVDFKVRAWTKASDYWDFYFDMQENVKLTFDKEGISIPFPQRDVHHYNEK